MKPALRSGFLGAAAGFLSRPCCALPAAMSLAGVSSAGVAQAVVPFRPWLLAAGAVMLLTALWSAFRNDSAAVTKVLSAVAALAGFVWSLRVLEVL